ncbi:MAG: DEAD/DEAH box helicase [Verrucomicrobiota bacterium]
MSQDAFALLHAGVQRAIWEMDWKQLRPIQAQAIHALLEGDGHTLICAATASGKTEAAFLPVVSRLADGAHDSIRAIYVGPLKALINDQFGRLDQLCERLEIPVHRWHGDVSAAHKQALRRNPGGILLITPESLESNFINYGSQIQRLYRDLEFVVIDEVHSFLGNVRGVHLLSLLSRLRAGTGRRPRMIGLSATLGDPEMGKQFLAPDAPGSVTLVQDTGSGRSVRIALKAVLKLPDAGNTRRLSSAEAKEFAQQASAGQLLAAGETTKSKPTEATAEEPDDLDDIADDLVRHFATSTNLVFVNSRRTAEALAVRVHDRVTRLKWAHDPFMIHHGSVAKELREEAEAALKSGVPTTAICSSTLEMGIDIGSVRAVAQVEPPWSVASLVQRLGRSGRREGESSIMRLYVREQSPHNGSRLTDLLFPELLRGIALTRLMQQKWLEPADGQRMHLSTLVHQIFSHLRQTGGMPVTRLHHALVVDGPFRTVATADFAALLRSLAARQLVEQTPTGEIILAPDGERITAAHDFYAAFKGTEMFTVRHDKAEIGELPLDALPPAGQLVVLAGKRWLVDEVDASSKTVWVSPAKGGKIPVFLGNGGELHTRIVREMRAVLLDDEEPSYLDEPAHDLLVAARHVARAVGLERSNLLTTPGGVRWFPWVGTRCLRTLALLTEANRVTGETDRLSLWLPLAGRSEFRDLLERCVARQYEPLELGAKVTPRAVEKFDEYLPDHLLNQACAVERLALDEARCCIEATLHEFETLSHGSS